VTGAARLVVAALVVALLVAAARPGHAHKPIISPFTFADDVGPILREHCGACHVSGGVAPMSLMTHEETVPWAEAIRVELISGHMPPWGVESAASRFANAKPLTARELNILLTWAAGGTPPGSAAAAAPDARATAWRLGEPDLVLRPADDYTLPADVQERVAEFTLETGTTRPRLVRAVDVRPGDATIVRSARVSLASGAGAPAVEAVLALWVPGDDPVAVERGGFLLPAGATLVLRVHYRKTWQRERDAARDRSAGGLSFAADGAPEMRAVTLEPPPAPPAGWSEMALSRTLQEQVTALAIYPDPAVHGVRMRVRAIRTDGSSETLIDFRPQANWVRRYWFREPIALPAGTRLEATALRIDEQALLPPGAIPRPPVDPADVRLTLNVIPAGR
jgi:hypothetical protein